MEKIYVIIPSIKISIQFQIQNIYKKNLIEINRKKIHLKKNNDIKTLEKTTINNVQIKIENKK